MEIQSRTYLTKAELIETNREPIVGDLVYGSDSYYAQIIRVGEGIVEIAVIGQIANLQAIYDLLDLKADLTYVNSQLDLTAKLTVSNVFTQPQQVPNGTLPQHTTNKLQVETMFEMFKQQLRGYNLAMPDLTGKEHLGDGWYRIIDDTDSDMIFDYDIYNGYYRLNSLGKNNVARRFADLTDLEPLNEYTIKVDYISGYNSQPGRPLQIYLRYNASSNFGLYNIPFTHTFILENKSYEWWYRSESGDRTQIFTDYIFTIQIEKGSTATPYTVPGQIPQYKIEGEE